MIAQLLVVVVPDRLEVHHLPRQHLSYWLPQPRLLLLDMSSNLNLIWQPMKPTFQLSDTSGRSEPVGVAVGELANDPLALSDDDLCRRLVL